MILLSFCLTDHKRLSTNGYLLNCFPLRAPLALSVGIGFMSGAQIDWNSPEARTLFQSRVACSSPGIRHYRRSKAYPCLSSAFASDQLCDLWQII